MQLEQVSLVQDSFEKVAGLGDAVSDIFYEELFFIDPSLRPLFKGNMPDQGRKLLAALSMVVRSLHAPEAILEPVQNLARRHAGYGVTPEHYDKVGTALLRTLERGLGAEFTSELRSAWGEAYAMLAGIMKDAAYGGGETTSKAAG